MAWRDREVLLNFTFLGDGSVEDEKERDDRRWGKSSWGTGTTEFRVRVNWPSPIQQVQVPIWRVIRPIWGLPNLIRQVVPLISHIRSYPPHSTHLHPPSLSFLSTTLPASQNTKLSHPSLSLHTMMMGWHRVQHTPSTAYTAYSIHRVQHPPKVVCLPFILMITSWPLNVVSASGVPPCTIDCHQPALHKSLKGGVTSSHSHGCELTHRWIESQLPACLLTWSTATSQVSIRASKVKSSRHIPTVVSQLTDE